MSDKTSQNTDFVAVIKSLKSYTISLYQDLRKTHCKGGIFELLDEVIVE